MGFSVFSTPSYLYQSTSGYIFRLRVLSDLRDLTGKCEFRSSLHAGAMRVPVQKQGVLNVCIPHSEGFSSLMKVHLTAQATTTSQFQESCKPSLG